MSNITLRNGEHHLSALLRGSPVTAARHGALGVAHDALLAARLPEAAQRLAAAAGPLTVALDVEDIYGVDQALYGLAGRPPTKVARELRCPEMVTALKCGLDLLGLHELADVVATWGPQDPNNPTATVPMSRSAWEARTALVDALAERVGELMAEWRRSGMVIGRESVAVDGRSLLAAARAWQLPMINGTISPTPTATAALHPNRLGRTAAVIAYSRMGQLIHSPAPDAEIFEALAMLVAVGEAISIEPPWNGMNASAANHGLIPVKIRNGESVSDASMGTDFWWPVFSSWGSSSKRMAVAIPTAWRLTEVEGDVLVWALCSAAARLAVAASAPQPEGKLRRINSQDARVVTWPEYEATATPEWESGARSVWALMQRPRRFEARTAWPECVAPAVGVEHSWPWRPLPSYDTDD